MRTIMISTGAKEMEESKLTGEVDDEKIDNELSNLKSREVLLPPNLVSSSGHEVVVVPMSKRRVSSCFRKH